MFDETYFEYRDAQIAIWSDFAFVQLYELDRLREQHPELFSPAEHIDYLLQYAFWISIGFARRDKSTVQRNIDQLTFVLRTLRNWLDDDEITWR